MNQNIQEVSPTKEAFNGTSENFNEFMNVGKAPQNYQNGAQQNYFNQNDYESANNAYEQSGRDNNSGSYYSYNNYPQYSSQYWQYPYPYNPNSFYNKFPRAKDYNDEISITEALPHLKGMNDPNFNIDSIESDDYFYIIRSSNDDNIHKAIKYHVWTSTVASNNKLREAWAETHAEGKEKPNKIYIIFSVVNSFQFMGVAEMASPPKTDSFDYWWEPNKWFGTFDLKWLFIKDIPHVKFEHIKEDNQAVTSCKDCTRLSAKSGKQILNIFRSNPNKPNIFEAFEFMDKREDILRFDRDRDPNYKEQFKKKSEFYKNNPEQFQARKPYYGYKRNNNYNNYNSNYNKPSRPFYPNSRNYNNYQNNYNSNYNNGNNYGYNSNGYNNYSNYNNNNGNGYGYNGNNNNNNSNNHYYNNNANANNNVEAQDNESFHSGEGSNHQQGSNSSYNAGNNYNSSNRPQQPKDLSEQFTIKKIGSKATDKAEKRKKLNKPKKTDDRVSNEFFDNKSFTPNQFNVQGSDDDEDEQKGAQDGQKASNQ